MERATRAELWARDPEGQFISTRRAYRELARQELLPLLGNICVDAQTAAGRRHASFVDGDSSRLDLRASVQSSEIQGFVR
jgi:hypothetical protein